MILNYQNRFRQLSPLFATSGPFFQLSDVRNTFYSNENLLSTFTIFSNIKYLVHLLGPSNEP